MEINLSLFKFCLQSDLTLLVGFLAESTLWDLSLAMQQGNEVDGPSRFLLELLSSFLGFPSVQSTLRSAGLCAYWYIVFCRQLPQQVTDRAVIPEKARFQNNDGFENQNPGFE